jgi:hypothetical protein
MLNDILVLSTAITLWLGLGYPVAKSLGPCVISRPLAAPPLGLAIQAIITTILYVSGVDLGTAFAVCFGLAIIGIAMAIRDLFALGLTRSTITVSFTLLPSLIGREGDHFDSPGVSLTQPPYPTKNVLSAFHSAGLSLTLGHLLRSRVRLLCRLRIRSKTNSLRERRWSRVQTQQQIG